MGSSNSSEIRRQEQFVHRNYHQFKKAFPNCSQFQIKGKLRQHYHQNDKNDQWILYRDWAKATSRYSLK
jgi:hypothetical protein